VEARLLYDQASLISPSHSVTPCAGISIQSQQLGHIADDARRVMKGDKKDRDAGSETMDDLSQTFVLSKVNREKRERKEARRDGERTDQN
jgi:hypothetical protein